MAEVTYRRRRRHGRTVYDESPLRSVGRGGVLALFLFLLLVSPLPMGANRDWAWSPMVVAIGAIAALGGVFGGPGAFVAPAERKPLLWLIGVFALFLLLALLQVSPLAPAAGSAAFYAHAREILGHAHAAVPSIAPDASYDTLLRCLACALFFLVGRALCRDDRAARLLLMTLLVSAIIVAAYGIYMQVSTHSCYLGGFLKKQGHYDPASDRCLMSGTFVSPNNYACYLGMAVVSAFALLFGDSQARRDYAYDDDEEDDHPWLTGTRLALGAVALLCLGGILISGSRAGFAATVAGVIALGYLLVRGKENFRTYVRRAALAAVLIGLVVGVIAGGSLLRKTVASSNNFNRVVVWRISLDAVAQSPLLGWGLGSYPDVYAIHQPATIIMPNDKAHSTPIEVLVEMGIPGGIAAMALVVIPWWICLAAALRQRRQRYLVAAGFAVVAVPILHSLVDFSLQIPAIAFVVSAFLGMGWGQAFPDDSPPDEGFTEES